VHNQKVDSTNLHTFIRTIEGRLAVIEHDLKRNIQVTQTLRGKEKSTHGVETSDIEGSLQAHLKNAQYILDLMN